MLNTPIETTGKDITAGKLETIESEVISLTRQAQKISLYYICEIGERLVKAKELVGHGSWGQWLNDKVNYSQSTAEGFMKIYNEWGKKQISLFDDANSQTFENLPYTKLLALTSLSSEERETVARENDVEKISVRELQKIIADLKAEKESDKKEADKLQKEIEAQRAAVEKATKEADALSEKLKAVAAQEHIPDLKEEKEKLRAESEKKLQNAKDALKKEKEKAAKLKEEEESRLSREKAEIESRAKEDARKEAEEKTAKLEKQLEETEKKLNSLSKTDISKIKVYFEQLQKGMKDIGAELGALSETDEETAQKLKAGIRKTVLQLLEDYI